MPGQEPEVSFVLVKLPVGLVIGILFRFLMHLGISSLVDFDVDISSFLHQHQSAGIVFCHDTVCQGSVSSLVLSVYIGSLVEQEQAANGGSTECCVVQGCRAKDVLFVNVLAIHGFDKHGAKLNGILCCRTVHLRSLLNKYVMEGIALLVQ